MDETSYHFLQWLPGLAALLALGVWGGKLERGASDRLRDVQELKARVSDIDIGGTRAMALTVQRLTADEMSLATINITLRANAEKMDAIEKDLAIFGERQRIIIERLDEITRVLSPLSNERK